MSNRQGQRIFPAICFLSFIVFLLGVASDVAAKPRTIGTSVEIDRPLVLAGDNRPVYVFARFTVPEYLAKPDEERPALNIALVLDRSGSMQEAGKLPYLKRAAKSILGRMSPRDRLAIVEYDDRVTVAWPSSPVESPALITKIIDALAPRGSTNLVAGMLMGVTEVRRGFRASAVNRVLLLSDGLANAGVTNPREIRKLAQKAKNKGVPITALGLGLKYDEDLMQSIAQNSGGTYYYIENPDQAVAIFEREISTLFRTAAREVDLRFIPGDRVKDVRVFGYLSHVDHSATVVEFPDFHTGEQRTLVLRLELKPGGIGPLRLGKLQFTYEDLVGGTRTDLSEELFVEVIRDKAKVRHAANREATVQAALVEAEARHQASLRLLEAGRAKDAERQLKKLARDLAARNADIGDIRLAKKIEAVKIESSQMVRAASAPASSSTLMFKKRSKQRLYEAMQGRRGLYMLSMGDKGHVVERLQKALKDAGAFTGPVDGKYSAHMKDAVKAYQSGKGLTPDGIAGPATLKALGLY